jgi:ferredoxin
MPVFHRAGAHLDAAPIWKGFGAAMCSSPWEWLWNGDEDVATPLHAGHYQDAPDAGIPFIDNSTRGTHFPASFFNMPKITILPQNVSADVESGETLLEAGEKAGVEMEAGCFNCSCGTCVAEVVSGMENLSEPSDEELDVLDQWNKDPDKYRLTCCVKIMKDAVVLKAGH